MTVWAYSDESERPAAALFVVVWVPLPRRDALRAATRSWLLPGQRRFHMALESPRRRRAVLDEIVRLGATATVFRVPSTPGVDLVEARRLQLEAATAGVIEAGVSMWVLDRVEPVQQQRDRTTIERVRQRFHAALIYDHRPGPDDPMLWIADAVVWAVGAGGDWARRVAPATTVVTISP